MVNTALYEHSTSFLKGNPIKSYRIGNNVILNDNGQESNSSYITAIL